MLFYFWYIYKMNKLLIIIAAILTFGCNNSAPKIEKLKSEVDAENVVFQNADMKIIKLNSPTNESLRGISVVDDTIAWFSGANGTILKTIDGGKTINFLVPPYKGDTADFRDIYAFNTDSAVLINSGFPGVIYRTNNKGKKWTKAFNFPADQIFYDAVEFADERFGIVYSDPVNGKHFILVSSNFGINWMTPPYQNLIPSLEGEAAFAASGSSIAFTPDKRAFIGLGGPKGRILTSKLPYQDWEVIETPIFQGAPTRGIYSMTFKSMQIGVAVGGDYTLPDTVMVENSVYTNDRGVTWHNPETPLSGYRSCVTYCKPVDKFIAIGTNGMDYSKDNGVNWIRVPDFNIGLNAIQFVKGKNVGYMIGGKGQIYKITLY